MALVSMGNTGSSLGMPAKKQTRASYALTSRMACVDLTELAVRATSNFSPPRVEDLVDGIATGRVDGAAQAKFHDVGQALVGNIVTMTGLQPRALRMPRASSDGPAPKTKARSPGCAFRYSFHSGSRRAVDQRGALQGHVGRDQDDVPWATARRDLDVLGESAGVIVAESREGIAEVELFPLAVDAFAAADHGGDHDLAADAMARPTRRRPRAPCPRFRAR